MLTIWYHDRRIGNIKINADQRWEFDYDQDWDLFPIMPQMPLGQLIPKDVLHYRLTEWFMDNLLPEGQIRTAFAKTANINENNTFRLLEEYGGDVAGAMTVLSEGNTPKTAEQQYSLITQEELASQITDSLKGIPMMTQGGRRRMSLAGAQDKVSLMYKDGEFYLPDVHSPSTHILKPDSLNKDYPYCPANEYFCMQLAKEVGLNVPKTYLKSVGDKRVYIIDRYDRVIDDHGYVTRLHQVDGCQALGVAKEQKYEDDGGITAAMLFKGAENVCRTKARVRLDLLDWVIFNYLIGNSDAHAKNFSFMIDRHGVEPAKLYDLVCVETYHRDQRLSTSIGGEMKAGFIEGPHWDAFSLLCNVNPKLTRQRLTKFCDKIESGVEDVMEQTVFTEQERVFLETIHGVIKERKDFVVRSLDSLVITKADGFDELNKQGTIIDPAIVRLLHEQEAKSDDLSQGF